MNSETTAMNNRSALRQRVREALILELGDTTGAYPFSLSYEEIGSDFFLLNYDFRTDKGTPYNVSLEYFKGDRFVYVGFTANDSHSETVDEGTTFKAISTIMTCLSHFWRGRHEILVDVPRTSNRMGQFFDSGGLQQMQGFMFQLAMRSGRDVEQARRFKLYKAFIDQQFPQAEVQTSGLRVAVTV